MVPVFSGTRVGLTPLVDVLRILPGEGVYKVTNMVASSDLWADGE